MIFVTRLGRYALVFGTGDREDLWSPASENGENARFYVVVDDNYSSVNLSAPIVAGDLKAIGVGDSAATTDYLLNPDSGDLAGWYLQLEAGERLSTKPFSLAGVTTFGAYQPSTYLASQDSTTVCGYGGRTRLFVLFTNNANPVLPAGDRYRVVEDFLTSPFTELGQTVNQSDQPGEGEPNPQDSDLLTEHDLQVRNTLMQMFPESCRFGNGSIFIRARRTDTGIEMIAPVPICVQARNWKEE